MACLDCQSNCFDKPLGCLYHEGKSVGVISQGDSQRSVNEKLAEELQRVAAAVDACAFCNGETPMAVGQDENIAISSNLKTVGTRTIQNSPKPFTINSTPSKTNVAVQYDFKEAADSLGGTIISSAIKVEGQKNGKPAVIIDSERLTSGFNLRPDNFPATLDADIRISTTTGEKIAQQRIALDSTGQATSAFLESREAAVGTLNNQKEVNELLDSKVNSLESRLNAVTEGDLQNRISQLEATISELQQTIADMQS